MTALLDLNLDVFYGDRQVLAAIDLQIAPGELVGLAGASGAGKSTLAACVIGLLRFKKARASGRAAFDGSDLLTLPEPALRRIRGRDIALVPQSPVAALNPALSIGRHFEEAWRAHCLHRSERKAWREAAIEALQLAHLNGPEAILQRRPLQISVGQAQRVAIALAILHRPRLIVADEATSALDPLTAAEILKLFRTLNRELGAALLFISHDLLSLASICHRIAVLHDGSIVEDRTPEALFCDPRHPYTQALVAAIPRAPVPALIPA